MRRSALILTFIITISILVSIVAWTNIIDKQELLERGSVKKQVEFETETCSYGYAYIDRDSRTEPVADWARFENNDSKIYTAFDSQNEPEFNVEIEIPRNVESGKKYFKVKLLDVYNNKQYSKTVSFKTR